MTIRYRERRMAWTGLVLGILTTALWSSPVSANSPDPILGGTLFATDQALTYSWDAAKVPDSWMQSGINAGAANSNKLTLTATLQGTKVATFAYGAGGTSKISMESSKACGFDGIACFSRWRLPATTNGGSATVKRGLPGGPHHGRADGQLHQLLIRDPAWSRPRHG